MAPKQRKLKRDARILKRKALASLRLGLSAFNSHEESGRTTAVLLHFQHATEMLLKAALIQRGQSILTKRRANRRDSKLA
jgi:HEPN domain-containing protein